MHQKAEAIPPLVAGDVPTAEKNHVEWFIGTRYQEADLIERQVPFTEVVYGISEKQELTFEIPYVFVGDAQGFGDAVLGTKYQFISEMEKRPGLAGSFEWKLTNGSQSAGLGTGGMEYNVLFRIQKTWGAVTGLVNVGYTVVGEPERNGVRLARRNVWFTAFAQEVEVTPKTHILSELYWKANDEPGQPDRLAADIGLKHHLLPPLTVHAAIGKSVREGGLGGPALRVYAGVKVEFAVAKR